QWPERLCDGHRVGAALADLNEDLEGIIVWRLVDRDERGADRGIGPVGRALEAVRARPDDRGRRGRHRYLLLDADVQDLLALAAVAEDRDAKAAELPREQVRARNVLLARAVRQVDGPRDAVVGAALKRRLMAHVPRVADLVRGPDDPPRVFRHARDIVQRAALCDRAPQRGGVGPQRVRPRPMGRFGFTVAAVPGRGYGFISVTSSRKRTASRTTRSISSQSIVHSPSSPRRANLETLSEPKLQASFGKRGSSPHPLET